MARSPTELITALRAAERVVADYFEHRVDDASGGTIAISGERYVLVRAASLSVEFFALVERLYGAEREVEARDFARNILFDLAHAIGRSDARRFHTTTGDTAPLTRLAAGPAHFSHSGWALVEILPESRPEPSADFYLLYDHRSSFESEAWLRAARAPDFPVCIMNAGYSSGWCEESMGLSLVSSEVLCRARGDECCRFVMAPPERIEQRVEHYIAAEPRLAGRMRGYRIPDFFARKRMEEQLRASRDDLEQRVVERTADLQAANERLRQQMADRARIEQQLRQTQRLESLGRLAGGIAHDFNNLLGVIMGYSSILQRRAAPEDPMQAMLAEITEAAQHAANLTRQLVTFSRSQVMKVRRLDLNEVVDDIARMLRHVLGDDIRLETRLAEGSVMVLADPSQMEQMLMNLAVNARDAMPGGGTISLETELTSEGPPHSTGGGVRLSVIDTGVGMDEATKSKVFDPFFTTKPNGAGSGLGLSTVYGIVTQCGGTITLDSAPARGTRFDILLPATTGHPESSAPPKASSRPARRGETILLVEDRIALRALLAQMLEDAGYRVLVAHEPSDALRLAEQHPGEIHLLLTDVVMPGMSGREVAERVLQSRPTLRVLFISGYAEDPELLDGALLGRSAFIRKPITPTDLDRAVRLLLDGDSAGGAAPDGASPNRG
jgi:two-component system cell cycle sensor histidine kinase/response regulator CckA